MYSEANILILAKFVKKLIYQLGVWSRKTIYFSFFKEGSDECALREDCAKLEYREMSQDSSSCSKHTTRVHIWFEEF